MSASFLERLRAAAAVDNFDESLMSKFLRSPIMKVLRVSDHACEQ